MDSLELLRSLIELPSISGNEENTFLCLKSHLLGKSIKVSEKANNLWVRNRYFDDSKPSILLNSHHDTVKPTDGYSRDPFKATITDSKIYGLGSNDAGGALVSLLAVFLHFYERKDLPWNLIYAATAEEEISGKQGIESILNDLGSIDLAIVGEPTSMDMAIAEKGLLVLDCHYQGLSGHAARNEGDNAIYKAMSDMDWFRTYEFEKISPTLGPVQMNLTQINAGKNHNVTPDRCSMVIDLRCNDQYKLEELVEIVENNTIGEIIPRSVRLRPSSISDLHPIVTVGKKMGLNTYGSPTLSDQALMPFTSIKLGPGDSSRSHTADEFIYIAQIEQGIESYIQLLESTRDLKYITKEESNETLG